MKRIFWSELSLNYARILKRLGLLSLVKLVPLFYAIPSFSQDLSELALFHRCYSQLTGAIVASNNVLLTQVNSGALKALDACGQVLDSAKLTGSATMTLSNVNDTQAQNVLTTFHKLHYSWFYSKDFPTISWDGHAGDIKDLYDSSSPALYYTRALFGSGISAADPVNTSDFLRAVRTNSNPSVGPESGHPVGDFIFQNSFSFAATGALIGVEAAAKTTLNFPANPPLDPYRPAGSLNIYSNIGGGFLGTMTYLNLNIASLSSYSEYKTDGAILMHRRWGKAVYRDTLCRELPVVRESDSVSFVNATSAIPFRTSSSCVKCHVSHDRISGVIRGQYVLYIGVGDPSGVGVKNRGGNFSIFHPVTKVAESSWPSSSDPDYFQRPPNGQIYLRNYNGDLIDQSVSSISDLGLKLSNLDDYYICLAKRYYSYFMGIEVDTGDLGDPAHGVLPGTASIFHRNLVINLGKSLKAHQSISQLIKDILNLSNYRKLDFGTKGATNGP